MTEKSASAFRTISEVAGELDLPQHVLRFWETKFPDIKPMKRGGGRRYYRPADVELLRRIRGLLHDQGYTIKGAQKLLHDGDDGVRREPPSGTENPAPGLDRKQRRELESIIGELESLSGLLKA